MILIGEISFRGGIRTKGIQRNVKKITNMRSSSLEKFLMMMCNIFILFILLNISFGKAFFPRSIFDKTFLKRFKERFVCIRW